MTPRFLLTVFDSVYLLALATWLGSLAFMTFGAAPLLLRPGGENAPGQMLRALGTRLYVCCATAGAIALPALLGGPLSFPTELRGPAVGIEAFALLAGTLAMLYGGNVLVPKLVAARASGSADAARRLTRRTVALNLFATLVAGGLLVAYVVRPVPSSTGIVELPPRERFAKTAEAFRAQQEEYKAHLRAQAVESGQAK